MLWCGLLAASPPSSSVALCKEGRDRYGTSSVLRDRTLPKGSKRTARDRSWICWISRCSPGGRGGGSPEIGGAACGAGGGNGDPTLRPLGGPPPPARSNPRIKAATCGVLATLHQGARASWHSREQWRQLPRHHGPVAVCVTKGWCHHRHRQRACAGPSVGGHSLGQAEVRLLPCSGAALHAARCKEACTLN